VELSARLHLCKYIKMINIYVYRFTVGGGVISLLPTRVWFDDTEQN